MAVPILCLVALFFLAWVIVLKIEIQRLRESESSSSPQEGTGKGRGTARVKGMRSYRIG